MIATEVMKRLNSFENSELQRVLEAIEYECLYRSGLSKICGGYSNAEAYDIEEGEDYDEDNDKWIDIILLEVDTGECGEGYTDSFKTRHRLSRKVIGDQAMTLKEKLRSITEA